MATQLSLTPPSITVAPRPRASLEPRGGPKTRSASLTLGPRGGP
jgi:hypothetical protein